MRRALAALLLSACGASAGAPATPAPKKTVTSNVLRADYAGSGECAECHRAIATAFAGSPMHNMTRDAAGATIRAPAEATFDFKGQRAVFTVENGARHLRFGAHDFTITRVIGGRTREDFVGKETGGEELVLPVSFIFPTGKLRYKGYSVMMKERPELLAGPVWRKTCVFCHNTVPLLDTLFDDLGGDSRHGYQGSPTDRMLPEGKLWPLEITDAHGLALAVSAELASFGAPAADASQPLPNLLTRAIDETRNRFGDRSFVEIGIGCEACHLGSRAHAQDPEVKPSFLPTSTLFRPRPPSPPTRAELVNHTCLRCHTVLFSGYPWTWEGGRRGPKAGGSSINSGEARDFLLGGCSARMACTTCHDPHGEDSRAKLDALGTPAGNVACTGCHPGHGPEHTHHAAGSAGSACLACHMPKKNMGLALEMTRYHRIASPTDQVKVLADRPLECALCHVDKSVDWIVTRMERLWGKRYPREPLLKLYGDLDANVVGATLARGLPHEQAAAMGALSDAGERSEELLPLLRHPYPILRHFAKHAIEKIAGRPLDLDVDATSQD